jgi:hypothetical protein
MQHAIQVGSATSLTREPLQNSASGLPGYYYPCSSLITPSGAIHYSNSHTQGPALIRLVQKKAHTVYKQSFRACLAIEVLMATLG